MARGAQRKPTHLEHLLNMLTIAILPPEVLLEVFKSYLEANVPFNDHLRFTLAAVCPRWRAVMFSTPTLWREIFINTDSVIPRHLIDPNPEEISIRTTTALRCARNIPLNFNIELPDELTPFFNQNHIDLLAPILRVAAPRIASLKIFGEAWEMHLSILQGLLNQPMPLLHSFIHCVWFADEHNDDFANPCQAPIPILQYPFEDENADSDTVNRWGRTMYPNLTHIEISGGSYNFQLLPTSGLRELRICSQRPEACPHPLFIRKMLSFSADTLEVLLLPGFLGHVKAAGEDVAVEPITLPNVQRLGLGYQDPKEVTDFLPWIRTPALKRLEIADTATPFFLEERPPTHPTDHMLKAIIHHLPLRQLEKLEIDNVIFKDEIPTPPLDDLLFEGKVSPRDMPMTLRFLETLTSLKSLELWLPDSHDHVLSLINYPRSPSFGKDGRVLHDGAPSRYLAHLPSLESLGVYSDDELMHGFVGDRAHNAVQERPLHVEVFGTVEGTLEEVLEGLAARLAGDE